MWFLMSIGQLSFKYGDNRDNLYDFVLSPKYQNVGYAYFFVRIHTRLRFVSERKQGDLGASFRASDLDLLFGVYMGGGMGRV